MYICVFTLSLLGLPPVLPRNVCRTLPTSPSWPCSSCTCWRLFLVTSPFTVTSCWNACPDQVIGSLTFPGQWTSPLSRRCGVRAAAHLQSSGPPGQPRPLRASGRAGGRHPHRSCGSFPSKLSLVIGRFSFLSWAGICGAGIAEVQRCVQEVEEIGTRFSSQMRAGSHWGHVTDLFGSVKNCCTILEWPPCSQSHDYWPVTASILASFWRSITPRACVVVECQRLLGDCCYCLIHPPPVLAHPSPQTAFEMSDVLIISWETTTQKSFHHFIWSMSRLCRECALKLIKICKSL